MVKFVLLIFATRAGSPQQHVPITVGQYCLDTLILVREANRSTRRKTLKAQKQSAWELNSYEIPHQTWFSI